MTERNKPRAHITRAPGARKKNNPPENTATSGCGLRAAGWVYYVLIFFVTVITPDAVYSQNISQTIEFEDLGFTYPLNVGARPAGLAGAYVAAGDDVYALYYNPAGLARTRRIELTLSLQQERKEITSVHEKTSRAINTRDGGIDGLAFAFPFPAYRGSLVAAAGVYRMFSGTHDISYGGVKDGIQPVDYLLQQTGSVYAYHIGFGIDLSPAISGGASLFVMDGAIDILRQYDVTTVLPSYETKYVKDDMTRNFRGYGGRVGVQFFLHRLLSGGVSFSPPVWIRCKSSYETETTRYIDNNTDYHIRTTGTTRDTYLLPYRIDAGLACRPKTFVFTFDVGYTDWTQAAIDKKRFRDTATKKTTFNEVFEFRFGAEYTCTCYPVRVRGGYAYRPYPLEYLQTDRIDENNFTAVDTQNGPHHYVFGLGGLVRNNLTVDSSFSFNAGDRSAGTFTDERTTLRFVLSAAYRF